ncbi:MAG: hypothetical protein LUQ26_00545 [Methylococcaceae bacterium]|nr:hypothetical protein [Methylococcaceae bacterium]
MTTFWESVKEKIGIVLITTVVSIATICSDRITGAIKTEINKSDQRPVQHEKIAKDISSLLFDAENVVEFVNKNLTTKKNLKFIVTPYNTSIETMRKNEYVYRAVVERYWDEGDTLKLYETFAADVRLVDNSIHAFNEEFSQVDSGLKSRADEAKTKPLVKPASDSIAKLQESAKQLLSALSE